MSDRDVNEKTRSSLRLGDSVYYEVLGWASFGERP